MSDATGARPARRRREPGDAAADDEEVRPARARRLLSYHTARCMPLAIPHRTGSPHRPPPAPYLRRSIGRTALIESRSPRAARARTASARAAFIVSSPRRLAPARPPRVRKAGADRSADPRPGRRALQDTCRPSARVYDALDQAEADRVAPCSSPSAAASSATSPASPRPPTCAASARARADHAAGAGRQRDRRQGRRQPRARQEPDRAPSTRRASWWSIRSCSRRCRGASSAPASTRSSSTA